MVATQRKQDDAQNQLERLLADARNPRAGPDAESLPVGERPIVLFGSGGLGRRTLVGLRSLGYEPIAFADSDPTKCGREIDGVPVISLEQAASRYGESALFIVCIWGAFPKDRMRQRLRQLSANHCERVVSFGTLYRQFPDTFLPYYAIDSRAKLTASESKIRAALDLFEDESSRSEFVKQVHWRLTLDFDLLSEPADDVTYFPSDLPRPHGAEVFVDCGAFDGDTIRAFLATTGGEFAQIIAFEPDPVNFSKLERARQALPDAAANRITLHNGALGAMRGRATLSAQGNASSAIGSGNHEVGVFALDEILGDIQPTFIKMDIEGSELAALSGARGVIGAAAPTLAISSYHLQSHLWEVPLLIGQIAPDHKLFLRPHDAEGWDLVCYAVPAVRFAS